MSLRRLGRAFVAALLVLLTLPVLGFASLHGQSTITAFGGPNRWDLSGTGDGWTAGLAGERPLAGPLAVELRVAYFTAPDADDDPYRALLPEVGLVLPVPGALPLRVAVGGGWSLGLGGWPEDDLTLFAALGLDLEVGSLWRVRPEVRVRAVDPWVGTISDFQVGIARRLGADR